MPKNAVVVFSFSSSDVLGFISRLLADIFPDMSSKVGGGGHQGCIILCDMTFSSYHA